MTSLHAASGNIPTLLADNFDFLSVLLLASECPVGGKLMTHLVTILHRLITHTALPASSAALTSSLDLLFRTAGLADEVQLRALQCVMPLLANYECHGEQLWRAYLVCFRMQAGRSAMVANAAAAIIRQLVIWLFEKAVLEENPDKAEVSSVSSHSRRPSRSTGESSIMVRRWDGIEMVMAPFAADAFVIFQDICLLLNETPAIALQLTTLNKR